MGQTIITLISMAPQLYLVAPSTGDIQKYQFKAQNTKATIAKRILLKDSQYL